MLPQGAMRWSLIPMFIVLFALTLCHDQAMCAGSGVKVKPLYRLANFSGVVPYSRVSLAVDPNSNELLVLDPQKGDISIFNDVGMEVYRTGSYRDLGFPVDLAVRKDGAIDLLMRDEQHYVIRRCNYRGEPVSVMELQEVPEDFSDMRPNKILWRSGLLYVVDTYSLRVTVFDSDGRYKRGYTLADVLELDEKEASENAIFGFTVDGEGSLLFTIPTLFSVYRVSPEGKVETFGEAGSSPGKFSIVSGIAVDGEGYIYLSDRNRSVIMIYSPDLKFRHEFGFRGFGPGGLIIPRDLDVDGNGTVYVAQMGRRGIKAFSVTVAH